MRSCEFLSTAQPTSDDITQVEANISGKYAPNDVDMSPLETLEKFFRKHSNREIMKNMMFNIQFKH